MLAVSKTQPARSIRTLAGFGQRAFGENYVQEALAKQAELADCALEWHMIGPLQSNKCREVAEHFDWLQTLDRAKLIGLLARHRPPARAPLNVLIQVNIDDEASKSGCQPDEIAALAEADRRMQPTLCLRGLMAIPSPDPDMAGAGAAFARMRAVLRRIAQRLRASSIRCRWACRRTSSWPSPKVRRWCAWAALFSDREAADAAGIGDSGFGRSARARIDSLRFDSSLGMLKDLFASGHLRSRCRIPNPESPIPAP